jgi:hypothetical protein
MLEGSMRTVADVERFLADNALGFQDFGDGMFIITDENSGLRHLAIKVQDNVVEFQLRVLDVPEAGAPAREGLFEALLRLNGSDLLHSAFALHDDGVYLQAALPLPNLDPNEMQAVLDDMSLAVSQHLPRLQGGNPTNGRTAN